MDREIKKTQIRHMMHDRGMSVSRVNSKGTDHWCDMVRTRHVFDRITTYVNGELVSSVHPADLPLEDKLRRQLGNVIEVEFTPCEEPIKVDQDFKFPDRIPSFI